MSKRRTFGRVRPLSSGRYQARYPTLEGDLIPGPRTYKTRREAEQFLSNMQSEQQRGEWIDPRASRVLLRDYATEWLKGRKLRPSTCARYQGLLARYILPKFGGLELGDVTTRAIRVWNAEVRTDHPDTAAQAYRLLTTIFNTANEDKLLTHSPCKVKGASQHKNPERPVATVQEIAAATDGMDENYRLAVPLACYCRLRRSEVLGLQRKHIDIEHAVLRVEQAWTVSGGKMHLGSPKTDEGRRTVQIPANVLPFLVDHLDRFTARGRDAWLFPGQDGSVISPRTLDRQWVRAREAIGRTDLRFHDLRHTGLTMVAMTGATIAEIMAAGGHASPAAALRYQHASQNRMTAITDALAAMAEGRLEPFLTTKGHARHDGYRGLVERGHIGPVPGGVETRESNAPCKTASIQKT